MDIRRMCELIDERQEELFELLSSMIRINSVNFSSHGNEANLSRYIHGLCQEFGLESAMYSPLELEGFTEHQDYLPGHGLENRYNVTARWRGKQDEDELMLMGHSDTVQIGDLANWTVDPFGGEVRDGKIWGRGACDDKYALATALFVIKLLKENGFEPKANLLFAAYVDEEYGGSHGALAAVLRDPCKRIVSMDGRENQIWHCGSGGQEAKYTYRVDGSVDSAEAAARAIPVALDVMKEFGAKRCSELETNRFYAGTRIPKTSLRYMGVRAGNNGMDMGVGELHFTYYTDKTKEEIYAEFAALEKVMSEKLAPLGIIGGKFVPSTRFFHSVHCEPDSEDVITMVEAAKEATGQEILVCGSCLSDLSVISKYGSSRAYAFGAGRDFSLPGGAHQPNEYITCEKLVEYTKAIVAYVIKVLG